MSTVLFLNKYLSKSEKHYLYAHLNKFVPAFVFLQLGQ